MSFHVAGSMTGSDLANKFEKTGKDLADLGAELSSLDSRLTAIELSLTEVKKELEELPEKIVTLLKEALNDGKRQV